MDIYIYPPQDDTACLGEIASIVGTDALMGTAEALGTYQD